MSIISKLKRELTKKVVKMGYSRTEALAIVKRSVYRGNWNGWASGAKATISMEDGLPGMYEEFGVGGFDWWTIDLPDGAYVEFINGGIAAVYN